MTPSLIWKKMVEGKVYTKEVVTDRINLVFAVNQITEDEYAELINLIGEVYKEQTEQ